MEWFYSEQKYRSNNLLFRDILKGYEKFYDKQKLINHYAILGSTGGDRKGKINFKRVLWCYLNIRGALMQYQPWKFNIQELLHDIQTQPLTICDKLVLKYYNTPKSFQYEDFLIFKKFFEQNIDYNYKVNKIKKNITDFYNKILYKQIRKNVCYRFNTTNSNKFNINNSININNIQSNEFENIKNKITDNLEQYYEK